MKHGISRRHHPRPEGKVHLRRSFPSKVGGIVSLGICHPCLSKGVLPCGRSSGAIEQPPSKSSPSGLPWRQSRLPCAVRSDRTFGFGVNLPIHTTSSAGRKKRRDDECFLDWFSRRTSSKLLGYNSSRQEDILHAISKKMKAIVVLNEKHRK